MTEKLWGDWVFVTADGKSKWVTSQTVNTNRGVDVDSGSKRAFVAFIMDPIIGMFQAVMNNELNKQGKPKAFNMAAAVGVNLTEEIKKTLTGKPLLKYIMQKWIPAADAILEMIVVHLPSPAVAQGYRFESLYAVRLGFLKSTVVSTDGREQVTGFHMAGELIGMDGIGSEQHSCDTVALEDTEVCVIPYDRLEDVAASVPVLRSHFHKVMSREIVREHGVMLLLGSMHAEERLAAFLLNLSQRFEARGYSRTEFVLRMTRAEIGSFLGLKLETVSRTFSKFVEEGSIEVKQRHVRILDPEALQQLVNNQQYRH
jgi:CRP/FNR family transcriptional regulator